MFRRFFSIFIILALPLFGGEAQVTTWNVLADSYIRAEYYPYHDISQLTWEHRRESLLKKIKSFDSDVLMLQEVEPSVYREMYKFLSAFGYEGVYAMKGRGRPEGSAIFYRTSFGEFLGAETIYYNDHFQGPFSGNIALLLFLKVEGKVQGFATSHIVFGDSDKAAEVAGTSQVQQFLGAMKAHPEVDSWIAGGDFNGEFSNPKVFQMVEAGFADACVERSEPTFIFPSPVRIDFLFHSTHLHAEPVLEGFDWSEQNLPTSEMPSDHLPVTVRFTG